MKSVEGEEEPALIILPDFQHEEVDIGFPQKDALFLKVDISIILLGYHFWKKMEAPFCPHRCAAQNSHDKNLTAATTDYRKASFIHWIYAGRPMRFAPRPVLKTGFTRDSFV